nr:MAG TPA: hypothetical protein [Caudoviricetes sp.]
MIISRQDKRCLSLKERKEYDCQKIKTIVR